jgi:NAD(P)-dependent dehydrogenase (short-subunit alcohol dehydrogenase family)
VSTGGALSSHRHWKHFSCEGYIDTKKAAGKRRQLALSRKFLVTFFYPRRLIAEAIVFEAIVSLPTDRASFIYGAKLAVDGGRAAI